MNTTPTTKTTATKKCNNSFFEEDGFCTKCGKHHFTATWNSVTFYSTPIADDSEVELGETAYDEEDTVAPAEMVVRKVVDGKVTETTQKAKYTLRTYENGQLVSEVKGSRVHVQ